MNDWAYVPKSLIFFRSNLSAEKTGFCEELVQEPLLRVCVTSALYVFTESNATYYTFR